MGHLNQQGILVRLKYWGHKVIEELVAKVFADRNDAHKQHWITKSYAEHVALGGFYDDVIEAIDSLVENYIGLFGQFDLSQTAESLEVPSISDQLQDTADYIEANRDEICQGSSNIGNLVDSLSAVYTKTLFLLRLK